MKYILLLALLAGSSLPGMASGFTIEGYVKNIPDSAVLYITIPDKNLTNTDSTIAIGGHFKFSGKSVAIPGFRCLRMKGKFSSVVDFYLEDGNIKISGVYYGPVTVTGTPLNEIYTAYKRSITPLRNQLGSIWAQLTQIPEQDTLQIAQMTKSLDSCKQQLVEATFAFIRQHPASIVTAEAMKPAAADLSPANLEKALTFLSPALADHPDVKAARRRLVNLGKTAPGIIAPSFRLPNAAGDSISLEKYRGKYVLIDFWASWCMPCRSENPNLKKAYEQYKGEQFEVIGISLDKDNEKWLKAIKQDDLNWINLIDAKGTMAAAYGIETIPWNLLIDPQGKIIAVNMRKAQLGKQLAATLK